MFTLVSTIEKKRLMFLVVPHQWVINKHLLFWPKHLLRWEIEKLRSDCNSAPEEAWVPQECVIKVENIRLFESGLELEKSFIDLTDTEAEERFLESKCLKEKKNRIVPTNSMSKQALKYDKMFIDNNNTQVKSMQQNVQVKTMEENVEIISYLKPEAGRSVLETLNNNDVNQEVVDPLNQNEVGQIQNNNEESESVDLYNALTDIVTQVIEKRCTKMEEELHTQFTQSNLQTCHISTKLDKLIKDVSNIINASDNDSKMDLIEPLVNSDSNFADQFPISDPDKVIEFEIKLSQDDNFRKLLLTELCKFGGTHKNEQADKVVYHIFDFLFEPELLVQFSWTGASKSQDITKQSFQKLHNIIDLVYDVLSRADSRHTKTKNESLIRDKVLKHTNQRLTRKRKNKKDTKPAAKKPLTGNEPEDNINVAENVIGSNSSEQPLEEPNETVELEDQCSANVTENL